MNAIEQLWPFKLPSLPSEPIGVVKAVLERVYWTGVTHGAIGAALLIVGLYLLSLLFTRVAKSPAVRIGLVTALVGLGLWYANALQNRQSTPANPVPEPAPWKPKLPKIRPFKESTEDDAANVSSTGNGQQLFEAALIGISSNAPDGTEPTVEYPQNEWFKNIGSKLDGKGMCVFTSFEFMCRWAGLDEFRGFRDWVAAKYPGGGYPEKLAACVKAYCKAKNILEPNLFQYQGNSAEILEACIKNQWMPCITLYHSPRYGGGTIYHMVNCPHIDAKNGAIQDNNFQPYEWASREETLRRVKINGKFWLAVLIVPSPPPSPRN